MNVPEPTSLSDRRATVMLRLVNLALRARAVLQCAPKAAATQCCSGCSIVPAIRIGIKKLKIDKQFLIVSYIGQLMEQ